MCKDEIITLADGSMYALLLDSEINTQKYFLAAAVDEDENPLNVFKVLKELEENGKTLVVEETDPFILSSLISKYQQSLIED